MLACTAMLVCGVLGLLACPGSASAHAALIATEPGQDAVVATVPAVVSLTFGEPVVVAPGGVRVFDPDGAEVDDGHAVHLRSPATVGVRLASRSPPGSYTVSWRVISADSHPVAGAFIFSVGHPSTSRAPAIAPPGGSAVIGVSYAITRGVAFASYALLVGPVALVLLCWPGALGCSGVRRLMLGGWAGLLATTVMTMLLQGPYANGLGPDRLLDSAVFAETMASRLGTALTARLMLLALTGAYLVLSCAWLGQLTRRGRVCCGALGAALASGLAATWAGADHAAVGLQPLVALPVDVIHLLSMGVWLGGLVTLVVLLRSGNDPIAETRTVTRFSAVATGCIVILAGTGSYQSWRQLGSWAAFGSTDYGRLLLVKIMMFAVMLGLATLSHRWVLRRRRALIGVGAATLVVAGGADRARLRRSIAGEAALGAIVLVLTALLVNADPARNLTAVPPGPAHQVVSYDTGGPGGQGRLIVAVDPAATGPNTIAVSTEDMAGIRRDVTELRTELTLPSRALGPFAISLQHGGAGRYRLSGVQLPYPGDWQLMLTVRSSDIDEASVAVTIKVR